MDRRLRELEKKYKESLSPEDHGKYLVNLVRAGLIDEKNIVIAAFFKHKGAEICARNINKGKPSGIIWKDILINNVEPKDICKNMVKLPAAARNRAALGVLKLIAKKIELSDRQKEQLKVVENKISEPIIPITGPLRPSRRQEFTTSPTARQNLLIGFNNAIRNMIIGKSAGINLARLYVYFEDDEFLKAIQSEVVPWALGEYR